MKPRLKTKIPRLRNVVSTEINSAARQTAGIV